MTQPHALHLIPIGGLGNRIRFVSSALQASPGRRAVLIDVRTNMFPGRLGDYLRLPPDLEVREHSFRSEKLLIQLLKTLTPLSRLPGSRVARYGAASVPPGCRVVSSFKCMEGMDPAHLPLQPRPPSVDHPYDAVHIRGTDNRRALAMNPMAEFEAFIEAAERPVYVASDSEATKQALRSRFGTKVFFKEIGLSRDRPDDLDAAFDELWCLIRAQRFRGSKGSSFSSLANAHRRRRAAGRT